MAVDAEGAIGDAGRTWTGLVDDEAVRGIVRLLRESAALLVVMARRLQRGLVRALSAEGMSTREIGSRFGVSHQRVSSLMSRHDD